MRIWIVCILALGLWSASRAQDTPINVLFAVDGSSSMLKKWGKEDKWTIAERSLLRMADSLTAQYDNLQYGLRVYGHQSLPIDNDCYDSELKLPIGKHDRATLKSKLISVKPKGITPLAYTLEETRKDFAGLEGQKNILILITDGSESCLGDPCAILELLLEQEVIVKPVIIGLDIDIQSLKDYHCIKETFNPHFPFDFERKVLSMVKQAINYTTLQIDLVYPDEEVKQSNIPLTFYNDNHQVVYRFYHRLDNSNEPDTLLVDPGVNYRIQVESLPPVSLENVKLKNNVHNRLSIEAPTCNFKLNAQHDGERLELITEIPYLIKKSGQLDYFHTGRVNTSQDYLYGEYDIDILTLPVIRLNKLQLNEMTREINIPAPGRLQVYAPFPLHATLFQEINKELVNIYTFPANSKQETLDLQPGEYVLYYRFDHHKSMTKTQVKYIEISSNKTVELKL